MAYFANGTEGECFDEQCSKCKYGDRACPIAFAQRYWNYEACNNEIATKILNSLVSDHGDCAMFNIFISDFAIDPNQLELF